MKTRTRTTVRFDTKEQHMLLKEAAALMHWDLNRFFLVAGLKLAAKVLKDAKPARPERQRTAPAMLKTVELVRTLAKDMPPEVQQELLRHMVARAEPAVAE
jgi:uncharacterized protein (DUF1778 family)